ncbi:DEAD/DEAH box helicase [Actinomadura scrupuli]|uniref:DEAD/DEAH box helicase n=1 Tax=Actinomadura scrupuli TaxID=559629 RepID=UPI003D989802
MFALHALWRADHRLALWAEDSAERPLPGARPARGARPPGAAHGSRTPPGPGVARAHPYACSAELVATLVSGAGPRLDWLVTRTGAGWCTLLMPSGGGVPLPSPELGGGRASGARGAPELVAWHVPALLFAPGEAAQLLGELFDPRRPLLETAPAGLGGIEVPYGASLRWLTRVHDLAWRLVGRGQVLPAVLTEEGTPCARWRPVPDAAGWREIGALTAAAPPVCRAEHPGRPAAEVVGDVLDALVDSEARAVLESRPPLLRAGRRPATAAERWLAALTSGTGRIDGADPAELTGLQDRLAAWLGSGEPATARLRLCFRLREPLGPDPADPMGRTSDDHWRLEFLLQADEPALLVDVADMWAGGPALTALEERVDRPQEVFLAELGRAVRCCPELRPALRHARPAALDLDRTEALGFLRDAAPLLTAAGFGVLLPSWWQRPATVGLALTARTAQPGMVPVGDLVGQDAIVAFGWQAAIGDQTLTVEELRELAAIGRSLLRVRGQWVEVDLERIAEAVAFLERENGGTMPAGRVLRTALDPDASAGGLPVTRVVADGWLGDLLSGQADLRLEPVPVPPGFGATLRPYQERGLAWLAFLSRLGLGAVLADDMGLGKTPQTLALLAAEHPSGPTLLICPMSLVGNWQRETAKFAPMLRAHVHHGARRLSGAGLEREIQGADLVITTYATAQRDHEALRSIRWRRIILDEAQHIKNSATRQATAIRSLPAEHRIALTGTPVENRLADLHAVLDFANPGLFGSAAGFRERYAVPIEQHGDAAAAAALRRRTGPFILRRLKTDPAIARDLPEKQEMTVMCNLTAEQAGLYQAVVTDMVSQVENSSGIQRKGLVLSTLGKLKQICNHPAQFLRDGSPLAGRSGKVARLEEILEEALAEGDKTLCFTQYAEFGALLRDHLTERLGREVLFLYGGVPKHAREEMIARFQAASGPSVFLLSLKAGGTGLNLTAATQVIHVDRWWNPAVEQQATDRAFRLGQRRNVQVRKFVCVGTVEERIDQMIHSKRDLAESAVGTGEDRLTELSTAALRELVALSADAVSE